MQSVQNLGLAIVPIVTGVIIDQVGYLVLELFLCICLCCKYYNVLIMSLYCNITGALIFGIALYILDSTRNEGLNLSAWARNRLAKQKEAEIEKIGGDG